MTEPDASLPTIESFTLTPRRLQIARLIGVGLTSEEIGGLLGLSKQTVMVHRREIYKMLGFHDRNDLDDWLARAGFQTRNALARKVLRDTGVFKRAA